MAGEKIKILLVDDHTILRDGIAAMLNQIDGIDVVGSLSSGEDAVNRCQEYAPDIIIMDIMMGGMTGLEATRWIKEQPSPPKIIIMSSEVKKEFVSTGIRCGIDGYLLKNSSKSTLVDAIKAVQKGEKFFNQAITNLIFEDFYVNTKEPSPAKKKTSAGLSKRENEVLEHLAAGKTNQETADILFISVKTVETHKTNILEKLGLRNTAELVRYAIKNNIISID